VPTMALSATFALRSSSTPGKDRMPVSAVAQRPPSQRRARTRVSVGDLGEYSRYVLWQWDPRECCISRTIFVPNQVQVKCNLTRIGSCF
jgi:hypothetical protein